MCVNGICRRVGQRLRRSLLLCMCCARLQLLNLLAVTRALCQQPRVCCLRCSMQYTGTHIALPSTSELFRLTLSGHHLAMLLPIMPRSLDVSLPFSCTSLQPMLISAWVTCLPRLPGGLGGSLCCRSSLLPLKQGRILSMLRRTCGRCDPL